MIAYFILFFMIGMLLLIGSFYKNIKKITFYISIFILVVFSGFRKNIGMDYINYLELFNSVKLHYEVPLELGYVLMMKLIIFVQGKYQLLVFITSLLTNVLIGSFILKNSKYPNYSLFMYVSISIFYLATFTAMRQFIAVAIFCYSLNYIISRQFRNYFLLILLGTSFHITMILLLPLYFMLNRKLKLWNYGIVTLTFVFLLKIVDVIFLKLGFSELYFLQDDSAKISPVLYAFAAVGLFFIVIRNNLINVDEDNTIYINMVFISLLITMSVFITVIPPAIILRMSSYFSIAYLILIPAFLSSIKNANLKYIYLVFVTFISVSYFAFLIAFSGQKYNLTPFDFTLYLFDPI
jgi:hypothetical protein